MIIGRDLFGYFDISKKLNNLYFSSERDAIKRLITENVKETVDFPAELEPLIINVVNDKFCWTKQYRNIPVCHQKCIDEAVLEWKQKGVVEESADEKYNSSLITAPKKENGVISNVARRVCIDLSRINDLIEEDSNDIPLVDEIFEHIGDSVFFSVIDLKSAYLQVLLHPNSRKYTSFSHKNMRYQFTRIPFGLKTAPSYFQRKIRKVLQVENCAEFAINFFDDIIVHSKDLSTHVEHVARVIKALTKFRLTISADKCRLVGTRIEILGHVITNGTVSINHSKFIDMMSWPRPTNKKELQRLLGTLNYFRKFIPGYSTLVYNIENQVKNPSFIWNSDLENDYRIIFETLKNAVSIKKFDPNKEILIATDAAKFGIGGIVFQGTNSDGQIVGIFSRRLKEYEIRYSIPKKELLAIVFVIKKFEKFLLGRRFTILTDNISLLSSIKQYSTMAWYDYLSQFSFDIKHIPGKDNCLPDALSRLYTPLNCNVTIQPLSLEATLRKEIEQVHSLGHYGASNMVKLLKLRNIKFKHMKNYCEQFIKECKECQLWSNSIPKFSPINPVFANGVWERIAMDLMGPMPANDFEFKFILVVVDAYTRYVVLEPIEDKSAKSVGDALCTIFSRFGIPLSIQSDNGTEFNNTIVNSIKRMFGISSIYSAPYHPSQNGLVERQMKTISSILKKITSEKLRIVTEWPKALAAIQFAVNQRFSTATNFQPFQLMFGRNALTMERVKEEINEEFIIGKWMEIFEKLYPMCEQHMKRYQEKMKEDVNSSRRLEVNKEKGNEYKVGDLVLYKNVRKGSKWDPDYEGPGKIVSINKRTGNYTLCNPEDREEILINNAPAHLLITYQSPGSVVANS